MIESPYMEYTLQPLSFPYSALEPYIDTQTMEIHHTKHHQAYIDKLNAVMAKYPALTEQPLENLMKSFTTIAIDDADKGAFKNHGGGHLNHTLFWELLGPEKQIDTDLTDEITKAFGSIDEFKTQFTQKALAHFGSGWAWLARDDKGALQIYSLPNQDSPYMQGHTPLIGLDVWEHAYYLKYQNKRAEYIQNWWNVLKVL